MAAKKDGNGNPDLTFEQHLQALEKVVADLEGEALALDPSIDRYKEGVAHLAACRRILDQAEQRLSQLAQAPDGTFEETPLKVGAEGLEDAGPAVKAERPLAKPAPKKPSPPSAVPADDELPF